MCVASAPKCANRVLRHTATSRPGGRAAHEAGEGGLGALFAPDLAALESKLARVTERSEDTGLRTRSRNVPNGRAVGGVGPLLGGRVPTFETLVQRQRWHSADVPMRDRRRACLSPRDEQERSRPLMPVRTYLGGYCTQNTRDGFGSRSAAFRPFRERSERRGPERVPGTFRRRGK